jgi:energy-coupling factor transport system ATP-binding protein
MAELNFNNLDLLHTKNIVSIEGDNFSGRTSLLQEFTKLDDLEREARHQCGRDDTSPATRALYIGPEIGNYRSGLAPTVRGELRLASGCELADMKAFTLAEEIGLLDLLNQNPGTLSGGQQAALVIINLLNKSPERIAIDCALEQVDASKRNSILRWMSQTLAGYSSIAIADNRYSEYDLSPSYQINKFVDLPNHNDRSASVINPAADLTPILSKPESIRIEDVTFGYNPKDLILEKASLQLDPGNVYHLLGENGAGKSTFAKLLTGILRANSGSFYFNDVKIDPWHKPGHKVTYHLQDADDQLQCGGQTPSVLSELKDGLKAKQDRGIINNIASTFGLNNVLDTHPFDLPFSVRKRVALAACLVLGKAWIILDEPTLGQDERSIAAIAEIVNNRAWAGVGFIIITHSDRFRSKVDGTEIRIVGKKLVKDGD